MSKLKRKKRKIKLALCRGCRQWKRPNRVKMVDPREIGIQKAPIPLCAKCRSKLVWKPIEVPKAKVLTEKEVAEIAAEVAAAAPTPSLADTVIDLEDRLEEELGGLKNVTEEV